MDGSEESRAGPSPQEGPRVLSYADAETGKVVELARFSQTYLGHLAAGKLESEGVPYVIYDSAAKYGDGGAWICVAPEDLERAAAVLAGSPARGSLVVDESLIPPGPGPVARRCPYCGSERLGRSRIYWHIAAGMVALCWVPVVWEGGWVLYFVLAGLWAFACYVLRSERCRDCGRKIPDDDDERRRDGRNVAEAGGVVPRPRRD